MIQLVIGLKAGCMCIFAVEASEFMVFGVSMRGSLNGSSLAYGRVITTLGEYGIS